jgi:hypothetical protein
MTITVRQLETWYDDEIIAEYFPRVKSRVGIEGKATIDRNYTFGLVADKDTTSLDIGLDIVFDHFPSASISLFYERPEQYRYEVYIDTLVYTQQELSPTPTACYDAALEKLQELYGQ